MRLLIVLLAFLSVFGFVGVVFGNPIPWDPVESFLHLDPVQYFSIIVSEFCGLAVGTAILVHFQKVQWQKAVVTMLIALVVSYILGVILWILAFQTGILTYNANPTNTIVLSLPEFIGIAIGTVIIRKLQNLPWKTALVTMITAMLTSLLINILIAYIHLTIY